MAKTEELPGVEGEGVSTKKIKALDGAIDTWRGLVEKRMALGAKEVEARDAVALLMHKHGLTSYPYWVDDDTQKLCVLEGSEKLKLKKPPGEGDEDEEGGGE